MVSGVGHLSDKEKTMYLCTNDTYCPQPTTFATIEEFVEMVRDVFACRVALVELVDGNVVDDNGNIVLRAVRA